MTGKKKILIVDDEKDLLLTTENRLKANHFDVVTCRHGAEAVQTAKKCKPDLILLDLLMPDRDGFQVLSDLKADEATKAIPVIIITVKFHRDDVEKSVNLGAVDYLNKPFTADLFLQKIKNALTCCHEDGSRSLPPLDAPRG